MYYLFLTTHESNQGDLCRIQGYAVQTSIYERRLGQTMRVHSHMGDTYKLVDSSNSSALVWSVIHLFFWERSSKADLCKSS